MTPPTAHRTRLSACTSSLLVLLATAALLASGVRGDCYWSDGTENGKHQPCYSPHGGAIGLCCGSGDVCLSNGVCMASSGRLPSLDDRAVRDGQTYYRGSCTYRDWSKGKNCPTVCIKGPGISQHTDVGMVPCPGSDSNWYCADGNMKKANCSTGAFIVSLPKPSFFTTIGVSPTSSSPAESSQPTSSSTATTTSSATATASATDSANSESSGLPVSSSAGGATPPDATTAPAPGTPSATSPPESSSSGSSAAVPLAVGVSIGGASIIVAGALGFMIWRRRKRNAPARAESPPPRNTPDDDILNSVLTDPLFRAGSLLRRQSNDFLNKAGPAGLGAPEIGSAFGANRAESFRAGSILSSLSQHGHPPPGRFSPDSVAMHDMAGMAPVGRGFQMGRHGPPDTAPGMPYDGQRLSPNHGPPPLVEHDGYSELPG